MLNLQIMKFMKKCQYINKYIINKMNNNKQRIHKKNLTETLH